MAHVKRFQPHLYVYIHKWYPHRPQTCVVYLPTCFHKSPTQVLEKLAAGLGFGHGLWLGLGFLNNT